MSNLSCKLQIFDEILLPPVELINCLENKIKYRRMQLMSSQLSVFVPD